MRAKAFFNSKNGIKTTLNSCELAEFLLAHKTLKINSQKRYAISEINKLIKMPLAEISQEISNLNLAEEAIATILRHIELSQWTTRTLTRQEFDMLYLLHYGIDCIRKKEYWDHNIHCPVLFQNLTNEISYIIKLIKEMQDYPHKLKLAELLNTLLERFETIRHFFPYCTPCQEKSNGNCQFWGSIRLTINELLVHTYEKSNPIALERYFQQLKVFCKCFNLNKK